MIQRKQTLYFILAFIVVALTFIWPFATSTESQHPYFSDDEAYTLTDHMALVVAVCLSLFVLIVSIFSYKNRSMQISIAWVGLLLCLFIPALAWMFFYSEQPSPDIAADLNLHVSPFLYVPAIILIYLGIRGVKSDIRLLKSSSSRLR